MSEKTVSTKDLARVLGRFDLLIIAISQILGAGILSMTGTGIATTGRSVILAFGVALFFTLVQAVPLVIVAGVVRMRGGMYTQMALLVDKMWAGVYIVTNIFQNMSFAMYALSFADYFVAIIPGVPKQVAAVFLLTLIFAIQYFGVRTSVTIMKYLNFVLLIAFVMFSVYGIMNLRPGYFSEPGFMTHGVMGVFQAGATLSFATGGATSVLNYSAEAKDPIKDIPIVIILSTLIIGALYAAMAMSAAGVLPVEQVAGQSLVKVAKTILPNALYLFFIIGGCWFNLSKTLLNQSGSVTKPLLQAVVDGWFPRGMAKLNKYKVPVVLLGIYYFVGLIPILLGLNISMLGNMVMFIGRGFSIVLSISIIFIPKVVPEAWAKSKLKMSNGKLVFFGLASSAVLLFQTYLTGKNLPMYLVWFNIGIFVAAVFFGMVQRKNVHMEVSYEEA